MMYKVISLFSGMGGMDLGFAGSVVVRKESIVEDIVEGDYNINGFVKLKQLPFEVIFQNDILPIAKSVAEWNNWNCPNYTLTDIRGLLVSPDFNLPMVDVVIGGFPCFLKDTHVLTSNGYKYIQDVCLDDELITHTGKSRKICNLQQKIYNGIIYGLHLTYHPHQTQCTPEHPFYVRRRNKIWNNILRKYEYTFNKPEWMTAENLTEDYYCGMVINQNSNVPKFTINHNINQHKGDEIIITLNKEEQWFLMGYFLGDGWIEETYRDGRQQPMHKIRFAINNSDEDEVVGIISRVISITDKCCSTGNCKKYGCQDFVWYSILKRFGKYAKGKLIPEWVQDAPIHLIQSFLKGYNKADGCISPTGKVRFTTISYNIALGIQRLYLKLGYIFYVCYHVVPDTRIICGRTVTQQNFYTLTGYISDKYKFGFIEDGYTWFKIKKIQVKEYINEPVYNFEVDTDNSYIVDNTIVHNCQDFSHSGKRKGFTTDRGTLYHSFIEVVKRCKPLVFVAENVHGLLTMKGVIETITADFSNCGYKVEYQLVKCEEHGIPQTRWRTIIMGVRTDKQHLLEDNWHLIRENKVECPVGQYLKHLLEPSDTTDPAQQVYSKASKLNKGQGQKEILLTQCAPTIRAEHHGNIEFRRVANGNNGEGHLQERRLTLREVALIQTFPPDCILTDPNGRKTSTAYKPIGNAVPPLLSYLIARKVNSILQQIK